MIISPLALIYFLGTFLPLNQTTNDEIMVCHFLKVQIRFPQVSSYMNFAQAPDTFKKFEFAASFLDYQKNSSF